MLRKLLLAAALCLAAGSTTALAGSGRVLDDLSLTSTILDGERKYALYLLKEIPHEFRIRDGEHNWPYWRESLPDVLEFVTAAFRNDVD